MRSIQNSASLLPLSLRAAAALMSGTIAVQTLRLLLRIRAARAALLGVQPTPNHSLARASSRRRLLIVGDSTARGIGAKKMQCLAGQLAARYPSLSIENLSELGARTSALLVQLQSAQPALPHDAPYDAVLIAAGGNDVMRGTAMRRVALDLRRAIRAARELAPVVVVANSANPGAAPLFVWPFNRWLSRRAMALRAVFEQVCREEGVDFVNFTFAAAEDPFANDPARYYAGDGLHPTAAAYAWCCDYLLRRSRLHTCLAAASA